jgi:hypothetical protein
VWPQLRPSLDRKALDGAKAVGQPADVAALAGLVTGDELAALASGLVRVALDDDLAGEVRGG